MLDEGMGRAVKNSLEIIIKQVHLEGGFERVWDYWKIVWSYGYTALAKLY